MIIYTHTSPDMDACVALWLLRREERFKDAQVIFVPPGDAGQIVKTNDDISVDIGGGTFDHHDGRFTEGESVCSATLAAVAIGKWNDPFVRKLARYVAEVDAGLIPSSDFTTFSPLALVSGLRILCRRQDNRILELAAEAFEAWYAHAHTRAAVEGDFNRHARFFISRWGLGAAVVTSNPFMSRYAFDEGCVVFIYCNEEIKAVGFTAPRKSSVDLAEIERAVREAEPNARADWHMHYSHKMFTCGSGTNVLPPERRSELSIGALIAAAAG